MVVKFGELTVSQLANLCNSSSCFDCPFRDYSVSVFCDLSCHCRRIPLDFKFDYPDDIFLGSKN